MLVFFALLLAATSASAASFDGLSPRLVVDDRGNAAERRSLDAVFAAGRKSGVFWRQAQDLSNVPGSIRVSFADTGARADTVEPADPEIERINVGGAWGRTIFSSDSAHVMLSDALIGRHPGRLATTLAHELFGHAAPGLKARAQGLEAYNDLDVDELYAHMIEAVVTAEIGGDAQYWDNCRTLGGAEHLRKELPYEASSYAALLSPSESTEPVKIYRLRLPEARRRLVVARRALDEAQNLLRQAEALEKSKLLTEPEDRYALALLRFFAKSRYPATIKGLTAVVSQISGRARTVGADDWKEWRTSVATTGASEFVAKQESAIALLSDTCRELQPGPARDQLAEATARLLKRLTPGDILAKP